MTATDPAVQAVAEALHADQCPDDECDGSDMGEYDRMAEIAVAEAEPHLTHQAEAAVAAARPAIEREAKAASVRASVLQGHLDALRKVLFEDAATDHDMRLRKAHAVIRQVEKMEPFENAYASLRAERDALAARLAAVEALFAGGPDTPCRTLWRATEGLIGEWAEIECVEVPLDELRAAFATGTTTNSQDADQ